MSITNRIDNESLTKSEISVIYSISHEKAGCCESPIRSDGAVIARRPKADAAIQGRRRGPSPPGSPRPFGARDDVGAPIQQAIAEGKGALETFCTQPET